MQHTQDLDREDDVPPSLQAAPLDQVFALSKEEQAHKKKMDKLRQRKLSSLGFEGELTGDNIS